MPAKSRGEGGVSASGDGGTTWAGGEDGGGGFIEECPGNGFEDVEGGDAPSAGPEGIPNPGADTLPSDDELIR
ncbi:hypothetical protein [Candidatus Nitrososphaera gargensis]|nr:hypothetical protein [Candidatus Nitrososphaera gargensis]